MDESHDLVVRTIREHARALLRTARRHSLCADDAHDAYQRALEIFLRRASTLDPATVDRWLHVVVKHEAMAVRKARLELVGSDEPDLDTQAGEREDGAEERILCWDRLSRSAEALQRLKPQELTALWLKASGLSYAEIAERQNWTYTKVNRCVTEGRRAFLARYAGIEAGEECARWAPVVAALVDGEATAEQLAAARPHLRRCAGCRATVRELRVAGPGLAGVLPAAPLVAGATTGGGGRLEGTLRALEGAFVAVQERAGLWVVKLQGGAEAVTGAKLAAVASAAVVAGGGAVTVQQVSDAPEPAQAQVRADRGPSRAGPARRTLALVTPPASPPAPGVPAPASGSGSGSPTGGGSAKVDRTRRRTGAREFRLAPARVSEFRAAGSGAGAGGGGAAATKPRDLRAAATTSAAPAPAGAGRVEFRAPKTPSAGTSASPAPGSSGSAVVEGPAGGTGGEFGSG